MSISRTRRERSLDHPSRFAQKFSTLILGTIFLLMLFLVVGFPLQRESDKNVALQTSNERTTQLTERLVQEQTARSNVDRQMSQLKVALAMTEEERDRYKDLFDRLVGNLVLTENRVAKLAGELETARKNSLEAQADVTKLTERLSFEQTEKSNTERQSAQLKSTHAAIEEERDRFRGLHERLVNNLASAQDKLAKLTGELAAEKKNSLDAQARMTQLAEKISLVQTEKSNVEREMTQLKTTLAATEGERDRNKSLLQASEQREKESQSKIANLETLLSIALASPRKD